MRSEPSRTRSRSRGQRTATGPMPVMISRSGRWPWRTRPRRPSSITSSACLSSKVVTSASTACPSSLARHRATSRSADHQKFLAGGKQNVSVGHADGGVESTIRYLIPSCAHQLSNIALFRRCLVRFVTQPPRVSSDVPSFPTLLASVQDLRS